MTLLDSDILSEAALLRHESKSLLRFIACGSVDHGKSSLLGRLLYETKQVTDDQLDTLRKDTRKHSGAAEEYDFSLLLDGLAAEREQKITIDLAFRFFATEKRKFIVADAPGHEQYTRNMATGASNADLALILINAQSGLTQQTRRHALIVTTLGVRHLVVAINKMDLVSFSQDAFEAIKREFREFAAHLGADSITFIPTSARGGDNVVNRSAHMDWYRGPTLLEHLEAVDVTPREAHKAFRMPVQWVNRPDAEFRGYCGQIAGGEVYPGMAVRVLPSGQRTRIASIVTADGELLRAGAGQAITLTLADEVDASRGDIIVDANEPASASDRIDAKIFWMGQSTLAPGGRYLIKLGTASATATVAGPMRVIDLSRDAASSPAERLMTNEFGTCKLELDRPLAADRYGDNRETGGFILIDPESFDTVAMGMVERVGAEAASEKPFADILRRAEKRVARRRSLAKAVSWRAAGSAATFAVSFLVTGSTTIAASITAAEIVAKIAFYYFHERAWTLVPWGQR